MNTYRLERNWAGYNSRGVDVVVVEAETLEEALEMAAVWAERDVVRDDIVTEEWEEL